MVHGKEKSQTSAVCTVFPYIDICVEIFSKMSSLQLLVCLFPVLCIGRLKLGRVCTIESFTSICKAMCFLSLFLLNTEPRYRMLVNEFIA